MGCLAPMSSSHGDVASRFWHKAASLSHMYESTRKAELWIRSSWHVPLRLHPQRFFSWPGVPELATKLRPVDLTQAGLFGVHPRPQHMWVWVKIPQVLSLLFHFPGFHSGYLDPQPCHLRVGSNTSGLHLPGNNFV